MAATPFQPSHLGAIPFDIYNDAPPNPVLVATPTLPGGSCNFVDLTPGANGSKCGCRRFWSRQVLGSPSPDQAGWCFCNHHACYHDDSACDPQPAEPINNAEQENERPRTGRDPLSPMMALPVNDAPSLAGLTFPSFEADNLSFIHHDLQEVDPYQGATAPPANSMPDTLAWADNPAATLPPSVGIPPIPSQYLMPSQTASTTSSIQARYLRPFAGKGLQTLSGVGAVKSRSSSQLQPKVASPAKQAKDSSFGRQLSVYGSQDGHRATAEEPTSSGVTHEMFKNMNDTVSSHAQRLDRLETVSFSATSHDECHEKIDHFDLRVTDLESRMDEVEKLAANENASVIGRQADKGDDAASQSTISVATSIASRGERSQELYSQVQSLQAQVARLQSVLPCWVNPWVLEVVFLPFPLKKIWQTIHQFKYDTPTGGDDWTQMTLSSSTLRSQSPFHNEWAPPNQTADWLLPRACSEKSIPDRRLRSRGLIRAVSVKGPDARSVHMAINSVFADVFREMQLPERPQSPPHLSQFLGLQSAWVPLRKIHKDSRLRFLTPGEMLSPAMWDVSFLHSVMMKAAEPRLFITHPDAYIQDQPAFETGWSWQRLRQLNSAGSDVIQSQEVEAIPLEEHWTWNEQLDEMPGAGRSLRQASVDHLTTSHRLQQASHSNARSWKSPTPTMMRGPSPILKGRRGSRPPNIRTASVPLTVSTRFSPMSGRRVASSSENRRISQGTRASDGNVPKRRGIRSPSYHRPTPGWSASPSPMPTGLNENQHIRGTTPFAYATPHSNAPLQEIRHTRGSSVLRNVTGCSSGEDEDADDDYDMGAYEDSSDMLDDDEDCEDEMSDDNLREMTHPRDGEHESQHTQLPEDKPWPGIEDTGCMSDGENVDPRQVDQRSDTSSQPSEYPSNDPVWPPSGGTEFRIHEDEDKRTEN
jgi:hypothetical protein